MAAIRNTDVYIFETDMFKSQVFFLIIIVLWDEKAIPGVENMFQGALG